MKKWTAHGSEMNTATWILDEAGIRVCTMRPRETDWEHAQFIVTACNAHDALVSALEALLDPATNEDSDWYTQARRQARAALAQVKA